MAGRTVLILGGGVGGVVAANTLRRRLGKAHRIVLVDRERDFALAAPFLWVMTGDRRPEQIARPLARLARKGIEVVRGEVESIDAERRHAVGDVTLIPLSMGKPLPRAGAGFGSGDFYAEPAPAVRMRQPSRLWHAGKVLFEKQVLWTWL